MFNNGDRVKPKLALSDAVAEVDMQVGDTVYISVRGKSLKSPERLVIDADNLQLLSLDNKIQISKDDLNELMLKALGINGDITNPPTGEFNPNVGDVITSKDGEKCMYVGDTAEGHRVRAFSGMYYELDETALSIDNWKPDDVVSKLFREGCTMNDIEFI